MVHRDRWLAALTFVLGALILAPGAFWGLPSSKAVVGGLRVLDGDVPYRDFWSMYAPGQFYAVAGLFRVFGRELFVQGLAVVLVRAATAALLFGCVRRLGAPRAGALVVAALFLGLSFEIAPELESYPPALLAIVAALGAIRSHVETGRRTPLVAAGLALGVAALFKHDVAAYTATAVAVGLTVGLRLAADSPAPRLPVTTAIALVAAGALAVAGPAIVWLAVVAGRDAWIDLIVFPATDFRAVRAEPYPGLWPPWDPLRAWLAEPTRLAEIRGALRALSRWLLGNLPRVAFVLGLVWLVRRRRTLERVPAVFAAMALAGLPLFYWAAHTQPNTHLTTMALLSWILGAAVWPHGSRPVRLLSVVLLLLWTAAFLPRPAESAARVALGWSDRRPLEFPGARGIRVSGHEASFFEPIVDWITNHVPPGEPIYVGIVRHDLPVIGNLRFHVLSRRLPAHRHHEIHPAITDDRRLQKETIATLEQHDVQCAVIWNFGGGQPPWSPENLEPRREMRRALNPNWGHDDLGPYLQAHFEPVLQAGEFTLFQRR